MDRAAQRVPDGKRLSFFNWDKLYIVPAGQAAGKSHTETARILLDYGAAVNAQRNCSKLVLEAVLNGQAETAKLLLARSDDPNATDEEHEITALMCAAQEREPGDGSFRPPGVVWLGSQPGGHLQRNLTGQTPRRGLR